MSQEGELVSSIERLGDLFGQATELANDIRERVKREYGYHGFSVGILSMCRSLVSAEESYNEFHAYFLEELLRRGKSDGG